MKKATKWLNEHGIKYQFHDFKKTGLEETQLKAWIKHVGWELLLNRRGTTWRKLPETVRESIDENKAIQLMLDNLSLIKRPVLITDNTTHVGFKADEYAKIFVLALF